MRIVTNVLRAATAAALALAIGMPAWAEEEEFPAGPDQPGPGDEALPGSEEEEMEEEEIDVMKTLEEIIGKMKDAEASLSAANTWKATDDKGKAIEEMDKFLKAQDLQEKAIREMSKIFDGSKDGQQKSIDGIEKLIKAAKEQEGNQQESEQKKKQQKKEGKKPQDPNQTNKPSDPANKPYNPNQRDNDSNLVEREGNLGDKWGNLPDKLRDELSQADDDFKNMGGRYSSMLHDYWRVLGSAD